MKKIIRQEDIGKALGIHRSTVCRALKNHPNINEETKEKIIKYAKEVGYKVDGRAHLLRDGKSKLIGLILPSVGRFFTPDMVSAIEKITREEGYNLIIFQSNDSLKKEKECITLCEHFRVDGLLASLSEKTKSLDHFEFFLRNEIPIVFVDRIVEQDGIAAITINDLDSAYRATKYLREHYGSKTIAGVFKNEELGITIERKKGFKKALEVCELPYYKELCFSANSIEEAFNRFTNLLEQEKIPDAVFVMTDDLLVGVTQAISHYNHPKKEKLRIGKDIAIAAVSNGHLPYYLSPSITVPHVKHSGSEVGEEAIRYLMKFIKSPDKTEKKIKKVGTTFVESSSLLLRPKRLIKK